MTPTSIILLAGGSSKLGRKIADHLSSFNYRIYSGYLSHRINPSPNIVPIFLDITDPVSCSKAVKQVLAREGRIDVLINAAGVTSNNLEKDFHINTVGPYNLMQAVIPIMVKNNSGCIINITSLSGLVSFPGFGPYSASKFALSALTSAFHYELENKNIRVVNLAPGAILNYQDPLPPNSARARIWLLKILLPLIRPEIIARKIGDIIKSPNPQPLVLIGIDTHLIYFLSRFLPSQPWHNLQHFVWRQQQ